MNNFDEIIAFEDAKEAVENVKDYNVIKEKIKVRLYNQAKAKEITGVYRSAEDFGFNDLILVPVIELGEALQGNVVMKIPAELITEWGITEDEVYAKGIDNLDYTIVGMNEMMRNMMRRDGMPEDMIEIMTAPTDEMLWIISNKTNICGASSIIKAKAELEKRFPEGYVVLPSSIHEVLVLPKVGDMDTDYMLRMVTEINGGIVSEEDRLADNVYEF